MTLASIAALAQVHVLQVLSQRLNHIFESLSAHSELRTLKGAVAYATAPFLSKCIKMHAFIFFFQTQLLSVNHHDHTPLRQHYTSINLDLLLRHR